MAPPVELRVAVPIGGGSAPAGGRRYRGKLEKVVQDGKAVLVNRVGLEDYTRGAVPGEVSPAWPRESLKAMSIVIRSYAFQQWQANAQSNRHLYSDVRSQEYCGMSCEDPRTSRAVAETSGLVLVYRGKVVAGYSHSSCGGSTEDIREVWGGEANPVFSGSECPWCAGGKHWGPWVLVLEKTELSRRLAPEIGARFVEKLAVTERTRSGRVKKVIVKVDGKWRGIAGARLRMLMGWNELRSARFEAIDNGGTVEFKGVGWGHGVGLCQEGAKRMAEEGKTFEEILQQYFPGAEVWRLPR